MNYFNLPKALPFKFVNKAMTGSHFDDKWFMFQIRDFEVKAKYNQKWVKSRTTRLQCEGTLAPDSLKLIDADGQEAKSICLGSCPGCGRI